MVEGDEEFGSAPFCYTIITFEKGEIFLLIE